MTETTNTPQELGRTETQVPATIGSEGSTEFAPSEPWRREFQKQATRAMLDKLNRIARARLGAYAGKGRRVDEVDVDDVVIGVLGDTWAGTLSWDPNQQALFGHLKDAVRFRVRNDAKAARKRRKHDEFNEDGRGESVEEQAAAGAVVPTMSANDDRDEQLGRIADGAIAALQSRGIRDAEVSALLDALTQRITDRDEIRRVTGMSLTAHVNAWRRLGRLVNQLPAYLRDEALAAMA